MKYRFSSCHFLLIVFLFGLLTFEASAFNYGDALDKTLLFFEAQRSGKLPYKHRVDWRANSALRDGFSEGEDLVGGYYDAGDHVKFGLPMAFSVTMLAWAAADFGKEIKAANQMDNTLSAIRWGTDYFIKAHTHPNVLWAQVGDGASDHYCWERAEDMTTPRTAYKIDSSNPGSDMAGETAAALAASSLVFKSYNSSYAQILLHHAEQLFNFADTFRGLYSDSIPNAKSFYTSSGYTDELLWAAAWLYRATNKDYYLKYVVQNGASMGGIGWGVREFSWDNKYAGIQILLSKVVLEGRGGAYSSTLNQYKAKADYFACACVQKNNGYDVQLTPGGLIYVREWNNLQYASSAAFLLAVYSEYLSVAKATVSCPEGTVKSQDLLNFAKSQADYILGKNPMSMSYLVGYGPKYPGHIHHRGASIVSISRSNSYVGCAEGFDAWYNRPNPNPNVIYGALVGGPDNNDKYTDERSNYEQSEPTISGTAPLVGLLAKLTGTGSSYGHGYSAPKTSGYGYSAPKTYGYGYSAPKTHYTSPSSYHPHHETKPYHQHIPSDVPIKVMHFITNSWIHQKEKWYRHKIVVKNVSKKTMKIVKLKIENLSGPIYGLMPTKEKHIYETPPLQSGAEFSFVYVQGGPQAKVSIFSYHQ